MRVIAGFLGGRNFVSPRGNRTHPMSEKARGALFNALGDIEGLTVLDAFAGSGALTIEAISRAAASAVAIDIDTNANTTIVNNLQRLGVAQAVTVIHANASSWSTNNPDVQFDLVLLDPPYDSVVASQLAQLANHARRGGLVAISLPPGLTVELPETFAHIFTKSYGDATLAFYRRFR